MLKIHVVRQGGHHYYVDDLVPGRAEGTRVAGESPGTWEGGATGALGVTGTVEAGDFGEVLGGRRPRSGMALRASAGARSVAGYDLTFCAPKSVSILHLLGPAEMAGEVGRGHVATVAESTDYLEREAIGVRRTHRGQTTLVPAVGVAAGTFLHRTSRALDPHLHSHVVAANVTRGVDGAWSAVDGRRLFMHAPAVQAVYHACLRLELTDRLGATWLVPPSGLGDVVGVDATMRRLFSRRSSGIEEHMTRWPRPGASPSPRRAFHATRPEKDRSCTVEGLMADWRQRATDFGFDLGDLTRVIGARRPPSAGAVDFDRLQERLAELAVRRTALARHDVVAVVAAAAPAGVAARTAEEVADRMIEAAGPPRIRPGGRRLPARSGDGGAPALVPRWSAVEMCRAVEHQPDAFVVVPCRSQTGAADAGDTRAPSRLKPPWTYDRIMPGRDRDLSSGRSRSSLQLGR